MLDKAMTLTSVPCGPDRVAQERNSNGLYRLLRRHVMSH
jgi:hypothetical protein